MAVLYGIFDLIPGQPDLIVSGINYGLNVGSGVTISGTVGAALEGAAAGIPSLAISLETDQEYHASYSLDIDFKSAGYFTKYFAKRLLTKTMPSDVDVLKVEVPADATPTTPWETTRQSTLRFYRPTPPEEKIDLGIKGLGYEISPDYDQSPPRTDSNAVVNRRVVAVTPLSLDLTSRVDLDQLKDLLDQD